MNQHQPTEALGLVVSLCQALQHQGIRYCHWKSNEAIDLSANGENDLDLLIDRNDADRFGEILLGFGFKAARPVVAKEVPGLLDHYGLDEGSGRLVHLQAHYQLVLGDDMTKNYHLPLEREYLDSEGPEHLFRLPAPDFELAIFVVRMILKHASWDAQACLLGGLSASEERELRYLLGQVPEATRVAAVTDRLPMLAPTLVERCLHTVESWPGRGQRASTARQLERALAPYARRPRPLDMGLRTIRRFLRGARHVAGSPTRKRLVDGGAVVALIGPPEVATRVADDLAAWLEKALEVQTFRFDNAPNGPSAADDYGLALRHATNGGISICSGFPTDRPAPDVVVELEAHPGADTEEQLARVRGEIWAQL